MELIRRNTDYALRVLTCMGEASKDSVFCARELSTREDVPLIFLHKIMQKLKRKGLVKSTRGRYQGGFCLTAKAQATTLKEVVSIMQGDFALNRCFIHRDKCLRTSSCQIHKRLSAMQAEIEKKLASVTVAGLVTARQKIKEPAVSARRVE